MWRDCQDSTQHCTYDSAHLARCEDRSIFDLLMILVKQPISIKAFLWLSTVRKILASGLTLVSPVKHLYSQLCQNSLNREKILYIYYTSRHWSHQSLLKRSRLKATLISSLVSDVLPVPTWRTLLLAMSAFSFCLLRTTVPSAPSLSGPVSRK